MDPHCELIAEVARSGAIQRPIESTLVPMRAEQAETAPLGPEYTYELKFDGIRCIARKYEHDVRLVNRHGRDITRVYPDVVQSLDTLEAPPFVVDGEIVALDENGQPRFERIAERAHLDRPLDIRLISKRIPATFVIFDLLGLGDFDLRSLPLSTRRQFLRRCLPESKVIRIADVFEDNPAALLEFCRTHQLEGLMAKRKNSPYRTGPRRSNDWVKWRNDRIDDFVIVGFTLGEGFRSRMGAIDVASFDGSKFIYRGKVGSGLDDHTIDGLFSRLMPLQVFTPTAEGEYHAAPRGRIHVRPLVVASVKYAGFSEGGSLRFPVFRGIRDDVEPRECGITSARAT